jgi:hypothetical protein
VDEVVDEAIESFPNFKLVGGLNMKRLISPALQILGIVGPHHGKGWDRRSGRRNGRRSGRRSFSSLPRNSDLKTSRLRSAHDVISNLSLKL